MKELRNAFKTNGNAKFYVMAAALVMTVINCFLLSWDGGMKIPLIILTGVLTFGLYYISDGITTFIMVILAIAKIVVSIMGLFISLFGFLAGIGFLLGLLILVWLVPASLFFCVAVAYGLPVIGVSLLYFLAKIFKMEDSADDVSMSMEEKPGKSRKEKGTDVDWDSVYNRVMVEVGNKNQ